MDREHRRYKPGHRLPALSPQQDDGLVLEVRCRSCSMEHHTKGVGRVTMHVSACQHAGIGAAGAPLLMAGALGACNTQP